MTKSREDALATGKKYLAQVYSKYHDKGMLAVYIWGSVTRTDFDPQKSDIDAICVVDEEFPIELNELIRDELAELEPRYEWGFQIIYLSELNGGAIKSRLARAMTPPSFLPSFPQWVLVAGKQYERTDFAAKDAPIEERIKENIDKMQSRFENQKNADEYRRHRDRKGIVKGCLQLIYNLQVARNGYFDLDYGGLYERANQQEKDMLDVLMLLKKNELYDGSEFDQSVGKILQFAKTVKIET